MAVSPCNIEHRLSESSTDNLRCLNYELREHLHKLRTQLEQQKSSIKNAHWQRVLSVRMVRQQEQKKAAATTATLQAKLQKEKVQELDHQAKMLQQKHDQELTKLKRVHHAEVVKLKLEVESKESLLQRFITESRRESVRCGEGSRLTELVHRLSELQNKKKQLEDSLSTASESEQHLAYELRRKVEQFQAELWKFRYSSNLEVRKLIERLKSKDKIISHLEKELGRRSRYALSVEEKIRARSEELKKSRGVIGAHSVMKMETESSDRLSSSPNVLGNGYETNAKITNSDLVSPADREQKRGLEGPSDMDAEIRGLQKQISSLSQEKEELIKDINSFEEKNKELIEKNKKFLEKNKELTSTERNLKDQTQMLTDENQKLKEQCEHSKRKISQLTRQLYNAKGECSNLASQLEECTEMKQRIAEHEKTIAALRESCSEKDRRIELIQHRKKRRRLLKSQEKCTGVKETFYGYDEDDRSVDSENSLSSVSYGTIPDNDLWDELSREEINKNYQRLMKEHLELQKSFTLFQSNKSSLLDPQREQQIRSQLESDLFEAHCRIAELENSVQTEQQMEAQEMLFLTNEILLQKNNTYETECRKLKDELSKSKEKIEDLEFRLLELEECQQMENFESGLEDKIENQDGETALTSDKKMADHPAHSDLSELHQEFIRLLEGQGLEADVILQKVEPVLRAEQQIQSLEYTAAELQRKVSSLQEEKAALEEMLLTPRQGAPHATSNEKERAEVLALKNQIEILEKSQLKIMAENSSLQNELQKSSSQNNWIKKQMDDLKVSMKAVSNDSTPLSDLAMLDKNSQTELKTNDKAVYVNSSASSVEKDEVISLEQKLQMVYEENMRLKFKLEEKCLLLDGSEHARLEELEEYCEDLQERMRNAEMSERQLREKLKLAEHTINDLESSEGHFREAVDDLTFKEQETKRQTHELHRTVRELKDIVVDKDIVEQALRDKVEFLEKAEAESSKTIAELQASERLLRQQLELQSDLEGDVYIVNQLRKELHSLENTNKELQMQVAELTENEEILRDNWRRVADEDANRRQCLEEKIKMLEQLNQDLKLSLEDAKEHFAFARIPRNVSLASELSASKSCNDLLSQSYSEERILELEAKLKSLEEKKDAKIEQLQEKIENLQEKLGNLRENEIKLSETLAEMEATEQELRVKISLYESKQVTVERMLRYEDEIKELHTSQENLLEKLDSLEDHEETLQEKLETMEKIHKAKVNSLEKKIKILQEEREKAKLKIEEVEKEIARLQQKCLDYTIEIEKLEKELVEAKSREEKAGEQIAKLEREVKQKESDSQIRIEALRKEIENCRLTAKKEVSSLENSLTELKEKDAGSEMKICKLEKEIYDLRDIKRTLTDKISVMEREQTNILDKLYESERQEENLLTRLNEIEKHEQELMEKLSKSEEKEKELITKVNNMETNEKELVHNLSSNEYVLNDKISSLTKQLEESKSKNHSLTTELKKNELQIKQYLLNIKQLETKEKDLTDRLKRLEESRNSTALQLENKIKIYEQELMNRKSRITELEQKEESSKTKMTELADKCQQLAVLEKEKTALQCRLDELESVKQELENKINTLETNLTDLEETNKNSEKRILSLEKILLEYEETVAENDNQIENLKCENKEFSEKCSELESTLVNREAVMNLLKGHISDLKKDVNVKSEQLERLENEVKNINVQCENVHILNTSVGSEKKNLEEQNLHLEKTLDQAKQEVHKYSVENSDLLKKILQFKNIVETMEEEKTNFRQEILSCQNEKKLQEEKIKGLEQEKANFEEHILSYQKENKYLEEKIMEIRKEKIDLEDLILSYQNEKKLLKEKVQMLQNVETEKSEHLEKDKTVSEKIQSLTRKNSELQSSVKTLQQSNEEILAAATDYRKKCDSLILENSNQKMKISELKSIGENLEKQLSSVSDKEFEIKDLKMKIDNYEIQLGELTNSKSSMEKEIDRLNSVTQSLKTDREHYQSSSKYTDEEVKKIENELCSVWSENETLRQCVSNLESQKCELESQIKHLSMDMESKDSQILVYVEDLNKVQAEMKEKTAANESKCRELEKTVTTLKHNCSALEKKNELLQDAEQHLMDRVTELEEIEQSLRNKCDQFRNRLESKTTKDTSTQTASQREIIPQNCDTCDTATDTSDLKDNPSVSSGRRVSTIFTRVQDLDAENRELSSKLAELEGSREQVKQLREKIRLLEESEDKLMERIMELEEGEERTRVELERMRRSSGAVGDLEAELSKLTKSETEWKNKWNSVVEDKCALDESLHKLEHELKKEKENCEKLLHAEKDWKERLDKTVQQKEYFEKLVNELTSELEAEKLNVKNLEKSASGLDDVVKEKNMLAARVEELKSHLSLARKQHEDMISRLEQQQKDYDIQLSMLQEKHSNYEKTITNLQKSKTKMEDQEKKLKEETNLLVRREAELKCEIQTLETELTDVCDKMKILEDDNSSLKKQCSDLQRQYRDSEERMKQLNVELEQQKIKPLAKTILPKIGATFLTQSATSQTRDGVTNPHQYGAIKAVSSLKQRSSAISSLTQPDSNEKGVQYNIKLENVVKQLEKDLTEVKDKCESLQEKEKDYKEKIAELQKLNSELEEKLRSSLQQISQLQNGASKSDSNNCVLPTHTQQTDKGFVSVTHLNVVNSHVLPVNHNSRYAQTSPVLPRRGPPHSGQVHDSSLQHRIQELESKLHTETERTLHLEKELEMARKKQNSLTQQITDQEQTEQQLKKKLLELQQKAKDLTEKVALAEKALTSVSCDGDHNHFLSRIKQLESRQTANATEDEQSVKPLKLKIESFEQKSLKQQQSSVKQKKAAMLDKPEDILMQQIKELERLEKHHKQQINDLEMDRERLHEIARKDKSLIHEQNVRICELQLSEKVLREQVTNLEQSERSLYCKCEQLESQISKMEDRIHELNVHERRLRDLVKKLKLDEELWLAKSENMELTVEELSASEANLKARLQELAEEKFGLAEKANYLDARIKELEMSETALFQRVKNYEHFEETLKNQFSQLENAKAAAQSKVSELDMMNMDMSQRYQRAVEENAVFLKHVQEQQGLVQDLSRQLMVVKDSELCLKQRVEGLEKSETALQKRVKEYELREIDYQSCLHELRQSELILKDRVNTLQRNESKMKYRIQELEGSGWQLTGNKEAMPQKLEEYQKRIQVLQRQIEHLQERGHLRLSISDDSDVIKVPRIEFEKMETKVALLDDAEVQIDELQKVNAHLKDTVSQLRQGKDVCGHEVELEALHRRLQSNQELVQRLKQNLSKEQVTSLWASDSDDQVPSMEILRKRDLQFLESERVMHTVRGLTGEKSGSGDSPPRSRPRGVSMTSQMKSVEEDAIEPDLAHLDRKLIVLDGAILVLEPFKIKGSSIFENAAAAADSETSEEPQISVAKIVKQLESSDIDNPFPEEEHWKTTESLDSKTGEKSPLSNGWRSVAKTTLTGSPRSSSKQEELVIGLTLQSESELSHCRSQNDSDSATSSPNLKRAKRDESSTETTAPPLPKTRPPSLSKMKVFAQGTSYYLPSSGHDASADESLPHDSANRQNTVTSLDTCSVQTSRTAFSVDSVADSGRGTASTSRGNIKDRIAQIERQLQGKDSSAESRIDDNDSVFTWSKTSEKTRQLEASETEVKQLKEEHPPAYRRRQKINKLEKELEEKRRHIEIFENWANSVEKMLKNKDKRNDRNIVQMIQSETVKLRYELQNSKYRREELLKDPAAMKTELDKQDREIAAKKILIDSLTTELNQWKQECRSIEEMRTNALDSLRCLEMEVNDLQETEHQLQQMNIEYNKLRKQLVKLKTLLETYHSENSDLKNEVNHLSSENEKLSLDVLRLSCVVEEKQLLAAEIEELNTEITQMKSDKDDLHLDVAHLKLIIEEKEKVVAEFEGVKDEIERIKNLLQNRMDRVETLKEENAKLRESLEELRKENDDLRNVKKDYDELKARFEILQNDLKKATQRQENEDENSTNRPKLDSLPFENKMTKLHNIIKNGDTENTSTIRNMVMEEKTNDLQNDIDRLESRVEHLEAGKSLDQNAEHKQFSNSVSRKQTEGTVTEYISENSEGHCTEDCRGQRAQEKSFNHRTNHSRVDFGEKERESENMFEDETEDLSKNAAETVFPVRTYEEFLAESGLKRPEIFVPKRPIGEHLERECRYTDKSTSTEPFEDSSNKTNKSEVPSFQCGNVKNETKQSENESGNVSENVNQQSSNSTEIKILLTRCRELEKHKSDLQAELKVTQSKLNKIMHLETENKQLQEKISTLCEDLQCMEKVKVENSSLKRLCEEKNVQIGKLQEQIRSLESLEMENIELKHQVEGKILELQFLSSGDLKGMQAKLRKLETVERENRVLNEQLEEKIAELEKLKLMFYEYNSSVNFDLTTKMDYAATEDIDPIMRNHFSSEFEDVGVGSSRHRIVNRNCFFTNRKKNENCSITGKDQQRNVSRVSNSVHTSTQTDNDNTTNCAADNSKVSDSKYNKLTGEDKSRDIPDSKSVSETSVKVNGAFESKTVPSKCAEEFAQKSKNLFKKPTESDESKTRSMLITLRSKLQKLQEVEQKNLTVQTKLEDSAKLLKQRFDELEKQKTLPDITALQTQVTDLAEKCREKDETIQQLMKELQTLKLTGETTPSSSAIHQKSKETDQYINHSPSSTPVSIVISPADKDLETSPQSTQPMCTSTPVKDSSTHIRHTSTTQTCESTSVTSATQTSSSSRHRLLPRSPSPQPPKNFRISRLIGNTGIMLSWQPTKLLEDENSNSSFVIGYKLFLDGRLVQQVSNPRTSKTVIENIDVAEPHHFAIQTVAANNQTSSRVELIYEGIAPCGDSDSVSSLDTSIMSSIQFDENYKRLFMAVYDYNPQKQPDQYYSKYELAFRAGDIVAVYGSQRSDGYYHGEIDGRRGLVPSGFLEEVPPSRKFSPNSLSPSVSPQPQRSRSPRTPDSRRRTPRS